MPARRLGGMSHVLQRYPELSQATNEQKIELIDELWESIRSSGEIALPASHLTELDRRLEALRADPTLAMDPQAARSLLRR
ncbi:MAG: addiction module protein [Opitutaceae bacterium]